MISLIHILLGVISAVDIEAHSLSMMKIEATKSFWLVGYDGMKSGNCLDWPKKCCMRN